MLLDDQPGVRGLLGLDPRLLTAEHAVALEERALVDGRWLLPVLLAYFPALAVRRQGVRVADLADGGLGDPSLQHETSRLRNGERIRYAPVGGAVHDDTRRAVRARDRDHALVAHLRARVDRERGPEAAIEDFFD